LLFGSVLGSASSVLAAGCLLVVAWVQRDPRVECYEKKNFNQVVRLVVGVSDFLWLFFWKGGELKKYF